MLCPECGKELPDNDAVCIDCSAKSDDTDFSQMQTYAYTQHDIPMPSAQSLKPDLPMKWYKFLIYFSLFVVAASYLLAGIMNFTGNSFLLFGFDSETLYSTNDGLRILDIGYGIVYIAMIPFVMYVRSSLSDFKKGAPDIFYICSAADCVITVSYIVFSQIITEDSILQEAGEIVGDILGKITYIALNINYFNKRKHLFVN